MELPENQPSLPPLPPSSPSTLHDILPSSCKKTKPGAPSSCQSLELIFSKMLTHTDVSRRLAWPSQHLDMLFEILGRQASNRNSPLFRRVNFQVLDEKQQIWKFSCSTRHFGHPKPVLTGGWLAFARTQLLQPGDVILFYRNHDPASRAPFVVYVKYIGDRNHHASNKGKMDNVTSENEDVMVLLDGNVEAESSSSYDGQNAIDRETSHHSLEFAQKNMILQIGHFEAKTKMTTSQGIERSMRDRMELENELAENGQVGIMTSGNQNGTALFAGEVVTVGADMDVDEERDLVNESSGHASKNNLTMSSEQENRMAPFDDKVPADAGSSLDRRNAIGDGSNCHALANEDMSKTLQMGPQRRIHLEDIKRLMSMNMKLEDVAKELRVSRSTLKRKLRYLGSAQWPSSRNQKQIWSASDNESTSSSKPTWLNFDQMNIGPSNTRMGTIKETTMTTQRQMFSDRGLADICSGARPEGSLCTFVVKATYKEDTIRFDFSLTSGFTELQEVVGNRLGLSRFKIKFLDDDNEWILLTHDSDLQYCLQLSRVSGNNVVRLSILDVGG